jgi:hypothetical protein
MIYSTFNLKGKGAAGLGTVGGEKRICFFFKFTRNSDSAAQCSPSDRGGEADFSASVERTILWLVKKQATAKTKCGGSSLRSE